jgi:hypothetical protein
MEEQGKLGDPAQERQEGEEGERSNYTSINQKIHNIINKESISR